MQARGEMEVQLHAFLTLVPDGGEVHTCNVRFVFSAMNVLIVVLRVVATRG
jgi:hypothetical protein